MSTEARIEELKRKFTKQQLAGMIALIEEGTRASKGSTEAPDRLETRERQVLWISGYYKEDDVEPGGFYKLIIKAFFAADGNNFRRLEMGFPLTAEAYQNYMSGALKEKYDLKD